MKETVENLNKQAIDLAAHGDYEMAIACLRKAIEIERNNAYLWYNLGVTYRDSGNTESAFESFMTARDFNPQDAEILESLAQICFNMGALTEATDFCLEGLDYNLENPRLWNLMGVINFNMGQFEDAATNFEQALIYSPYYYDALFNLRDTYEELHNRRGVLICEEKMKQIKKR